MSPRRFVLALILTGFAATTTAQSITCDSSALASAADTARSNIIAGVDGAAAIEAWKRVFVGGGAVAWTATEYNVDARSTFVFAFDRESLRVYRAGAFGEATD